MFWDNLKHWNLNFFFLPKHVLLEISSGGILERGDFVLGGYCPGGYCPGDIVRGDIVLIPPEARST